MYKIRAAAAAILACMIISLPALSATRASEGKSHPSVSSNTKATRDKYLAALDSLRQAYLDWKYEGGDTLSNPYLFQLLSSPTFFPTATQQSLGSLPAQTEEGTFSRDVQQRTASINSLLSGVYATQPWLISRMADTAATTADSVMAAASVSMDTPPAFIAPAEVQPAPAPTVDESKVEVFLGDMDAFHIKVKRPNFWSIKGNFNVQLQQTYFSDNWYKGGDNSFAANGQFSIEANYDNKQKLRWDNKLELKMGFQTVNSYSLTGRFKPTADLLRLTSKVGIKAFNHWYYTLALQTWTQMAQSREYYNDADGKERYRVASDFMSPFEAVLSLGMEYKLEKKRFTINANLAPVAVNYKHVSRTLFKDDQTLYQKFGLKRHDRFDFGSTFTVTTKLAVCKQLVWDSRLYFFTSYHHTTAEWENTFSLKVNKYLSTKLFLYPRFDDAVQKGSSNTYFQFKEYLSVGLDVSF